MKLLLERAGTMEWEIIGLFDHMMNGYKKP